MYLIHGFSAKGMKPENNSPLVTNGDTSDGNSTLCSHLVLPVPILMAVIDTIVVA